MKENVTTLVDMLFSSAWLAVCELRSEQEVTDGQAFYRRACGWVESWHHQLTKAGISANSREQMIYAVCALLDESVLDRPLRDDGYRFWLINPLQAKYFNTMQAGEDLWERIRNELQQTAPDPYTLTCFYRVLQLGFGGRYRARDDERREDIVQRLRQQVETWSQMQDLSLIARSGKVRIRGRWYWLWWLGGVALLIGAWLLFSSSLQQMLLQAGK